MAMVSGTIFNLYSNNNSHNENDNTHTEKKAISKKWQNRHECHNTVLKLTIIKRRLLAMTSTRLCTSQRLSRQAIQTLSK